MQPRGVMELHDEPWRGDHASVCAVPRHGMVPRERSSWGTGRTRARPRGRKRAGPERRPRCPSTAHERSADRPRYSGTRHQRQSALRPRIRNEADQGLLALLLRPGRRPPPGRAPSAPAPDVPYAPPPPRSVRSRQPRRSAAMRTAAIGNLTTFRVQSWPHMCSAAGAGPAPVPGGGVRSRPSPARQVTNAAAPNAAASR